MAEPNRLRTGLVWAARILVAGTFAAAAVPKLADPAGFAEAVANYQTFPHWSVNLIAGFVPALELLGALMLLVGYRRPAASVALGGLTLGFIVLIASVIVRGIDVGCGCFGRADAASEVGWPLLLRDVGLLVAIVVASLPVVPGTHAATRARRD